MIAKGKVLSFQINIFKAAAIESLCREQGLEIIAVPRNQMEVPLGILAGLGDEAGGHGTSGSAGNFGNTAGASSPVRRAVQQDARRQTHSSGSANLAVHTMPAVTEEMLVLCGITPEQLDALLTGLQERDCPLELKAILTPTNAAWTPVRLYRELQKERAAL